MTNAAITKALNKPEFQDEKMSLGFRRYTVLPQRVQRNIQLSHYLRTGSINTHDSIVQFFSALSESDYMNYMRLA